MSPFAFLFSLMVEPLTVELRSFLEVRVLWRWDPSENVWRCNVIFVIVTVTVLLLIFLKDLGPSLQAVFRILEKIVVFAGELGQINHFATGPCN